MSSAKWRLFYLGLSVLTVVVAVRDPICQKHASAVIRSQTLPKPMMNMITGAKMYHSAQVSYLRLTTLRPRQNGRNFADDIFVLV